MYERFTDRARKVMQLAYQEAARFNHKKIGTEHLLLGLIKEGTGVAANVLMNLGISLARIRHEVEMIVHQESEKAVPGKLPQTPRAKRVIENSVEEARNLEHNYVGTEHLLLSLLREQAGLAAQVFVNLGVTLQQAREEVLNLLGPAGSVPAREPSSSNAASQELPGDVLRAAAELDAQIERLYVVMWAAVAEQRFEEAARLRDQADISKKRKKAVLENWGINHPIDPLWWKWNDRTVARLTWEIKVSSRWELLPVLGDALEEAGCTDQEILGHCHEPGEHSDRCWVVELLLGNR
jgi:ATP-dependent Clp protease ATP-binding subunit ClpA